MRLLVILIIRSILWNNQVLENNPPWKRNFRYLNQRLYLFPHKTVRGNLILANPSASDAEQQILLSELKIDHLINRYPHQLSGGESFSKSTNLSS